MPGWPPEDMYSTMLVTQRRQGGDGGTDEILKSELECPPRRTHRWSTHVIIGLVTS